MHTPVFHTSLLDFKLAPALSLSSTIPPLNLQVYEAVNEYLPQGAGVLMNINGFRALEAIDPALYHT